MKRRDIVIDYSFMHLGGLYQGIVNATVEASRRFGTEKAMSVIQTAFYPPGPADSHNSMEAMQLEILQETGLDVTEDDMVFLAKLSQAKSLVNNAVKILEGV